VARHVVTVSKLSTPHTRANGALQAADAQPCVRLRQIDRFGLRKSSSQVDPSRKRRQPQDPNLLNAFPALGREAEERHSDHPSGAKSP
jgi:hypothetical protein